MRPRITPPARPGPRPPPRNRGPEFIGRIPRHAVRSARGVKINPSHCCTHAWHPRESHRPTRCVERSTYAGALAHENRQRDCRSRSDFAPVPARPIDEHWADSRRSCRPLDHFDRCSSHERRPRRYSKAAASCDRPFAAIAEDRRARSMPRLGDIPAPQIHARQAQLRRCYQAAQVLVRGFRLDLMA